MNIPYDDNYTIINMDETPCSLEMGFETTIDFKDRKNIELISLWRESYRISIILSFVGIGYKLPPLLIIKWESGKSIEKELRL